MRPLFVPGARLVPAHTGKDGVTTARVLGMEDYIRLGNSLLKNLSPSP